MNNPMKFNSVFAAIIVNLSASALQAYEWQESEYSGLQSLIAQQIGDPTNVETGMSWSAFRIESDRFKVELIETSEYLGKELSAYDQGALKEDSEGNLSTLQHSLDEVWQAVSRDPSVIGVVPVGYLERGGVPQIAGLLRINGEQRNPLMHAPTLTNIYCIDNIDRHGRENITSLSDDNKLSTSQWAYTFPIRYNQEFKYDYTQNFEDVIFDQEGLNAEFQKFDFAACQDLIQSGPRILEPHQRPGENGLKDRRSLEIKLNDEEWENRATRTVLAYDLTGHLTFISSHGLDNIATLGPAKLAFFADLIEDPQFYAANSQSECHKIELQRSGGDGEILSDGTKTVRSKSCEHWATALTSFEHSGFILRKGAHQDPIKVGYTNRTIPAALVIRAIKK